MSKAVILLLVAILGFTYGLHMQMYSPSKPGGTFQPVNGTTSGTKTPRINGQTYVYTGPFTLACWLPSNNQAPYRWDTCYNQVACYNMLLDYQNCIGTVKKYPPVGM